MGSRGTSKRGTSGRGGSSRSKRGGSSRSRSGGSRRRYGNKASTKVERAMGEMKRGQLRSGRSRKKVTNPKQAVAIGLSEARREGGKVPSRSRSRSSRKGGRRASAS